MNIPNDMLEMWRNKADDIDDDCRVICENHAAFAHAGGMILGIQTVAQEIRRSIDLYMKDNFKSTEQEYYNLKKLVNSLPDYS